MDIPHTKTGWQKIFMMLKYTLHTFTLTSSHITWVHVTSVQLQSNKILIDIYNKILNFDMQVLSLHEPPPKSFHPIAQRELIGQGEKHFWTMGT